jgi:carbon-monoxide dehydrogenase medium subunit
MKSLWESLHQPSSLEEALVLIRRYGSAARIIAGGTDVIVEMSRGAKLASTVIDISRVAELDFINVLDDRVVLGALATHNDVISDANCVSGAFPLVQAGVEIGAPQLRTRATVAGNIATASPANDTISALISLDASVSLRNLEGCRSVPIEHFITGFRRIDLEPDELIESISIPRLQPNQRGLFRKLGLRQAQAISVVHFAIVLSFDAEVVTSARIALSSEVLDEASRLAASEATPIDDVRGSGEYRSLVLKRMLGDALDQLGSGSERNSWQGNPVLLDSGAGKPDPVMPFAGSISTQLNGRDVTLSPESTRGTLLNAVRDELSLTGSKEGCAEGECGACTMWLDGQAVMSCLVPAAQAHGREVVTIEGLAESSGQAVHPLQASFVERAAIQCGFCIPGMVMAGAKLLEERPLPTRDDLKTALSGNICRCTGYTKIIDAMNQAAGHDH